MNIRDNVIPVAFWGYEQVSLDRRTMILEIKHEDPGSNDARMIVDSFCIELGARLDNKIVLKLQFCESHESLFLQWHDGNFRLGMNIRPYRGDVMPLPSINKERPATNGPHPHVNAAAIAAIKMIEHLTDSLAQCREENARLRSLLAKP